MFRKKHHRNDKITKCYDSSLLVILSDKTKQYLLQEFETNFGFVQTLFRGYRAGHQSDRALGTSVLSLPNTQSNHLKRTEKGQSQVTDLQRCMIEAEIELQSR